MAKLELEINGNSEALTTMTINGKFVKLSDLDGKKVCHYEVDGRAEVIIYKTHHYATKNWFWWSLLYFFVSMFGLFDTKLDKKFIVIDCRFVLNVVKDTKVIININDFKDGEPFAQISSEAEIEMVSNDQHFDKDAVKKHKKMKKIKFLAFVLIVVLVCLILCL